MGRYDRTPSERFFEKVEQPPYSAACWPWTASKDTNGYGHMGYEGRIERAHRVSWILHRGPLPTDGRCVLHTCDNPACVNPDHLWLGTKLENNLDKMRKGRHTEANKTHCKRGHPLSGDNLYIIPTSGARECRECKWSRGRTSDCKRGAAHRAARREARLAKSLLP